VEQTFYPELLRAGFFIGFQLRSTQTKISQGAEKVAFENVLVAQPR
jgi:hypothetical protein